MNIECPKCGRHAPFDPIELTIGEHENYLKTATCPASGTRMRVPERIDDGPLSRSFHDNAIHARLAMLGVAALAASAFGNRSVRNSDRLYRKPNERPWDNR